MRPKFVANAVRKMRGLGDRSTWKVKARRVSGWCVVTVTRRVLKPWQRPMTVEVARARTWDRAYRQAVGGCTGQPRVHLWTPPPKRIIVPA